MAVSSGVRSGIVSLGLLTSAVEHGKWRNTQEVVYMDPHLEKQTVWGIAPSKYCTLKPLHVHLQNMFVRLA